MSELMDVQLKETFETVLPGFSERLERVSSDEDIIAIHEELIAECRQNLDSAIAHSSVGLAAAQVEFSPRLTPKLQKSLASAKLDNVKKEMLDIMRNLEKISKMKDPPPEILAPALVGIGFFSMVGVAINDCAGLEAEADVIGAAIGSMKATTAGAAAGTAPAIPMAVIVAVVLLVVAVISTIIYLIATTRKCVILFVNELDEPLTFGDENFLHGGPKTVYRTEKIVGNIEDSNKGIFPGAGFVIADKKFEPYGTQFGFSYKYGKHRLAIGALCGLRADNQCWCSIGGSAKKASREVANAKDLQCKDAKENIRLTINCNSHEGHPAFFIARAHFA
jgi:hypothetical protein